MGNPLKHDTYRISANVLNMGLSCPFKLMLYLLRVKPEQVDYSNVAVGSAAHAYMENLPTHKYHPLKYYADGKYEKDASRRQVVPVELYDKLRTCMNNGREWFGTTDYTPEQAFELNFVTPKGRNVTLNGRIDAMTETKLWDWKTAKAVNKEEYRRAAAVYDMATNYSKDICYKSLLTGDEVHFPHVDPSYVPALCDQYIDRIESHDFSRKRQFLCKWCDYETEYCFKDAESTAIPKLINVTLPEGAKPK